MFLVFKKIVVLTLLVGAPFWHALADTLVLANVNVLDVETGTSRPDQSVLIVDGLITDVGAARSIAVPREARIVEGLGRTVLPGLTDSHVHMTEQDVGVFLANGVTSVRELNGSPEHVRLRDKIEQGKIIGPRMLVSSPLVSGKTLRYRHELVEDSVRATELVKEIERAGYDYVKIYDDLTADSYKALIGAARELQLMTVGHIPASVGLDGVLLAEQSLEHNEKIVVDVLGHDMSNLGPLIGAAEAIAQSGVVVTPTLAVHEFLSNRQSPEIRLRFAADELAYVDEDTIAWWKSVMGPQTGQRETRGASKPSPFMNAQRELLMEMSKRGVPILAGTDTPNPLMIAGFSLHDELAALVRGGLSPLDAICSATAVPGTQLTWSARIGKIEVGYAADLVLVEGNPIQDLSILRHPSGVVANGIWLDRDQLDNLLTTARRR